MLDTLQNTLLNRHRYKTHSKAVIVACFFNPQRSPYRLIAFQKWYHSIQHLNHRIIECTIGEDHQTQLPESPYITHVHAPSLLWHKETLLNKVIAELPTRFRYVFWIDTDVLFTNQEWLPEGVEVLQDATILQPFTYCVHLDRHEVAPSFDTTHAYATAHIPTQRHPHVWKSFAYNCVRHPMRAGDTHYDRHGHVGFAWGARREVLDAVPLYDKALIGGADHIIAHAAAGHIPHPCIAKAFPETHDDILVWSHAFYQATQGKVGYVAGELYHLWHGDLTKRQYLQRIQRFSSRAQRCYRNEEGFWLDPDGDAYMLAYYAEREAAPVGEYAGHDDGFEADMGYSLSEVAPMGEAGSCETQARAAGMEPTEVCPVEPYTFEPLDEGPSENFS